MKEKETDSTSKQETNEKLNYVAEVDEKYSAAKSNISEFDENDKAQVANCRPPSRSTGGLGSPSPTGPAKGDTGPLLLFPIGLPI